MHLGLHTSKKIMPRQKKDWDGGRYRSSLRGAEETGTMFKVPSVVTIGLIGTNCSSHLK